MIVIAVTQAFRSHPPNRSDRPVDWVTTRLVRHVRHVLVGGGEDVVRQAAVPDLQVGQVFQPRRQKKKKHPPVWNVSKKNSPTGIFCWEKPNLVKILQVKHWAMTFGLNSSLHSEPVTWSVTCSCSSRSEGYRMFGSGTAHHSYTTSISR